MVLLDGQFKEMFDTVKALETYGNNAKNYYDKYLPEIWASVTEETMKKGHGGMDYFEFAAFVDALREGREMPIDVYDAAAWMSIAYLTEQSIAAGGVPVEIPDFTNGAYKTRPMTDVVEIPVV